SWFEPNPASSMFGNVPTSGMGASEVMVAQAILRQGDDVPLPTYADGTQALQSEVFWVASLWRAQFGYAPCTAGPSYSNGDHVYVEFRGRTLSGAHGEIMHGYHCTGADTGWPTDDVQVLVTVVAVRS